MMAEHHVHVYHDARSPDASRPGRRRSPAVLRDGAQGAAVPATVGLPVSAPDEGKAHSADPVHAETSSQRRVGDRRYRG